MFFCFDSPEEVWKHPPTLELHGFVHEFCMFTPTSGNDPNLTNNMFQRLGSTASKSQETFGFSGWM